MIRRTILSRNFADHRTKLPVCAARYAVDFLQNDFDSSKPVAKTIYDRSTCFLREAVRRNVSDPDQVQRFLNDLRLANRQIRLEDRIEPADPSPIDREEHVVGPSINRSDDRKSPSATAGLIARTNRQPVANSI